MTTATALRIKATLTIDGGDHSALQPFTRAIGLRFPAKGGDVEVAPTKATKTQVSWDVDGKFGRGDGLFDTAVLYVIYGVENGQNVFAVEQSVQVKADGSVAPNPDVWFRRAFGSSPNPLFQLDARLVGGGVVQVTGKVRVRALDLTDHLLDIESTLDPSWRRLTALRRPEQSAGCDVRVLGVLDFASSRLWTPPVVIAPAARSGTTEIGGFTFYLPGAKNLDHAAAAPGTPDAQTLANEAEGSLLFHVGRYLRVPSKSSAAIAPSDVPVGQPRPFFGQTDDDGDGFFPNAQIPTMLARVGKPLVVLFSWVAGGNLRREQAEDVVQFLWGQNHVATDKDSGVHVRRFGVSGFSESCHTAYFNITQKDDTDEVYLFDPIEGMQPSFWFKKNPTKRKLRIVSGSNAPAHVGSDIIQFSNGVASVKDLGAPGNVSWFPSGMLEKVPGAGKSYWTDFYGSDPGKCHPLWSKAYEWFRLGGARSENPGWWPEHQYPPFGGEIGASPLDPGFLSYFGQCLSLSDF